jgi:hypothetical protein
MVKAPTPKDSEPVEDYEWFYTDGDKKAGPVTAADLRLFFKQARISETTHVWRKGLKDWLPIRETDIIQTLSESPPPVSPSLVRNDLVWIVAFLPLISEIVAMILRPVTIPWYVWVGCSFILCIWDVTRLGRAGYRGGWYFLVLFLAPSICLSGRAN